MISGEDLKRFAGTATPTLRTDSNFSAFDMDGFVSKHNFEVLRRKPWQSHPGGIVFELARCPFNSEHTGGSAAFTMTDGVPGFSCKHSGCARKTIKDIFGIHAPKASTERMAVRDEWPDPLPLGAGLPTVETFDEDLLPSSLRKYVVDVAERMQVPLDYPAAVAVVSLAGSVNRRAMIQPKARDTGFRVIPNLWGGIVGRPGYKKSPVIEAVTRPLRELQRLWFEEHTAATVEYGRDCEMQTLRISAWKQQMTSAMKSGRSEPTRPEELQEQEPCRRILIGDATFEALHKAMGENPEGLLVIRDELAGWLAQLEKSGREGERAFCLEAWNGNSNFIVDRIERGTINVPHVCMSLIGGIQPARLRSYMSDAVESGPGDDGLIQRFQVLVWPDPPSTWTLVDREPDSDAEEQLSNVYSRLVELSADPPVLFRFTPDAQKLFWDWYSESELRIRKGDLHDALTAHLSKYVSLMPSLALLFALADQAAARVWSSPVASLNHAEKAAAWCYYLESHARRVYSTVVSPRRRAAAELAEKIKRGELGKDGTFAIRDVYRNGWSGLDTHDRAAAAVLVLQDHDWVRELAGRDPRPNGGRRSSQRYQVNPKVVRII